VVASIPYDEKTVLTAVNKGVPPTLVRSSNTFNQAFEKMAETVAGKDIPDKNGKGVIRKIFSF